ncbi:MAG: hypothetical protein DCC65_14400 [Planctomycetota bacterium]|nr:MAG: hypothetical protein DCC65_14400 [Planctomycetota bacterium]
MRPSARKWILLLAALSIGAGAVWSVGPVNALREEKGLVLPPLPKTIRPSMLLTPMLALGRAPLVDYLWIRATTLKEEGRYFDAYQLSEMICELQPKFGAVWGFQGWNMAYNISVTCKTPEERWRWVRNGYELIRDRGIPLNPNNTQLYRELAWILFHKVGDYMDEMHNYYKLQFALIMEDILGDAPPEYHRDGRVPGDYYRDYDFASLAAMPRTYEELIKDPSVKDFADKVSAFGFDASQPGLFLGLLKGLVDGTVQIPNAPEHLRETRLVEFKALMNDPATAAARGALERFWRADRLRTEVKLEPQRIVDIQNGFGVSLDWRLPEAHALYWANLGLEKGLDSATAIDVHKLNTNRIEFFCLQKMFYRGRMAMSPSANLGEPPYYGPDIRMAKVLFNAYLEDSREYLKDENQNSPVSINFVTGFVGFVRTAIVRYHELGMQKEAQEFYDFISSTYPDPIYEGGLDKFLARQFAYDRKNPDLPKVISRIEGLIQRGLIQYGYGEDEEAIRYLNRAREVFNLYRSDLSSKRLDIPRTFPELVTQNLERLGPRLYKGTYDVIRRKLGLTAEGSAAPADGSEAASRPAA